MQIAAPGDRRVTLELHRGTIINPLGTSLAPGMRIAVRGSSERDGSIAADQIDVAPSPHGPRAGGPAGRPPGSPPAPLRLTRSAANVPPPDTPPAPPPPGAPPAPAPPPDAQRNRPPEPPPS